MADSDPNRDETLDAYRQRMIEARRAPSYYAGATETLPAIPRRANMATGETALAETPKLPPAEQPNYLPDIPRAPMTLNEQLEQRRSVIQGKLHPDETGWGRGRRFLHGLNVVGQDVATALRPDVMYNIPGTIPNMRMELGEVTRMQGEEQEREALRGEAKARTGLEARRVGIEEQKLGMLERLPGVQRYDPDTGELQYGFSRPGQTGTEWHSATEALKQAPLPGAEVPGAILSGTRNAPTPPPPAVPGALPNVQGAQAPTAAPMAAPTPTQAPRWVYSKPEPKNEEEQFIDKWLREKGRPDNTDNRNLARDEYRRGAGVGEERARQARAQIEGSLKGTDLDPAGFMVSATSKADEVKEAVDAARRAATEYRLAQAPSKAEETKSRHTWGYSATPDGQTIWTTEADANAKNAPFNPEPQGESAKDRKTIGAIGDVQMNISRYTKSATDYNTAVTNGVISQAQMAKDQAELHNLLNKAGLFEVKLTGILELDLGPITALGEALSREAKSRSYDMLSDQAKNLYLGYLRSVASVPAYVKVLTDIGRNNKETLDLELKNIADPSMGTTAILQYQKNFQENIDRATKRLPNNLPGLENSMPGDIRKSIEGTREGKQVLKFNRATGKLE